MFLANNPSRDIILEIFQAGLVAADPYWAVKNAIQVSGNRICFDDHANTVKRCKEWPRLHIISFGKAACAMATAAVDCLPVDLDICEGIIVTNQENSRKVEGFDVYEAGHPLPDARGMIAARRIEKHVLNVQKGELLLVLISGGGSALLSYPSAGISLDDKIYTTQLLLNSGATINEVNCIRKHISQLKGGNLACLAQRVDLHALILSDVIGDDPSAIASGPTVPDSTTFQDAIEILYTRNLWEMVPDGVRSRLQAGYDGIIPETPKPTDPAFNQTGFTLVGGNSLSVSAMQTAAQKAGFETETYSTKLCGEVNKEAAKLCRYVARKLQAITTPMAILAGGETTVTVKGVGLGGRNQQFALAFAMMATHIQLSPGWVLLSAGTDGRDGPTDAAGAIVDSGTVSRICAGNHNPANYLENNDSYHALQRSNDLLIIGSTGTNVADLMVVLLFPDIK